MARRAGARRDGRIEPDASREVVMGKGRTVAKVAAIGAAIAGVIFFWRKRQAHEGDTPAGDTPAGGTP
jgi:hypothetical protein